MNKKILFITLTFIFFFFFFPFNTKAATISFDPQNKEVIAGSTFSLPIIVTDAVDLDYARFEVSFDSSALTFNTGSVEIGDLMQSYCLSIDKSATDFGDGSFYVGIDMNCETGVNGTGTVAILNFTASSTIGTSSLSFIEIGEIGGTNLYDSTGATTTGVIWEDGIVDVISPTPEVHFTPQTSTTTIGDQYAVTLSVNDVIGMTGAMIDINYDESILEYVSSTTNALFDSSPTVSTSTNTISFSAEATSAINGDIDMVTFYFNTLSVGTSSLAFDNDLSMIYDSSYADISAIWTDGEAEIIDDISPVITNTTASELPAGTRETNLTITTNEDATCKYSITEGTSFASSTLFTTTGSITHSTSITGLENGNTYNYYIISQDNYSNTSTTTVSFSVASLPALYCGDGECNNGETCSTCPADCGRCSRRSSSSSSSRGSYTPPKVTTLPDPLAKISNTTAERTDDSIIFNWTNPTDVDFKETIIIKSSDLITSYLSYEALSLISEVVYQGIDEYYKDLDIEKNIDYYYAIFTVNNNGDYSDSIVIEKKHLFLICDGAANYGEIKSLANITSEIVEKISLCEAKMISTNNKHINFNNDSRRLYLFIANKATKNLSEQDKFAIAFYIHEGSQTTKILGAGERTGVLNSYLSVFGRLPETETDWQDVIKIANGRWPTERNLEAELLANKSHFVKVYLREPNMDNANDNAAVTVITYGLRPADRNLDSEKVAIKTFKHIYGYNPSSAIDWDITRAIAYSGAIR